MIHSNPKTEAQGHAGDLYQCGKCKGTAEAMSDGSRPIGFLVDGERFLCTACAPTVEVVRENEARVEESMRKWRERT